MSNPDPRLGFVERPPGGNQFDAVFFAPEGWRVLAPWVTTPDGYYYRPHVAMTGKLYGDEGKRWAEHLAVEINRAMEAGR